VDEIVNKQVIGRWKLNLGIETWSQDEIDACNWSPFAGHSNHYHIEWGNF